MEQHLGEGRPLGVEHRRPARRPDEVPEAGGAHQLFPLGLVGFVVEHEQGALHADIGEQGNQRDHYHQHGDDPVLGGVEEAQVERQQDEADGALGDAAGAVGDQLLHSGLNHLSDSLTRRGIPQRLLLVHSRVKRDSARRRQPSPRR